MKAKLSLFTRPKVAPAFRSQRTIDQLAGLTPVERAMAESMKRSQGR